MKRRLLVENQEQSRFGNWNLRTLQTIHPALAVGVVVLYILIQKIEGYVLVPKVMQKAVGASPLVILLSLLIGFKLAGIVGLLLAVPVASALLVVIEELRGEGARS